MSIELRPCAWREGLEGLLWRSSEVDDGEGGDEVGGVGALVRVQRRVVHDLLLRQRVRLRTQE